jgi:hypothetical protein
MLNYKVEDMILDGIDYAKKAQATVSLFDHLGYPAGTQLGADVYRAAKRKKEPVGSREVKTKTYTGKVMLYRKEFLIEYFNNV